MPKFHQSLLLCSPCCFSRCNSFLSSFILLHFLILNFHLEGAVFLSYVLQLHLPGVCSQVPPVILLGLLIAPILKLEISSAFHSWQNVKQLSPSNADSGPPLVQIATLGLDLGRFCAAPEAVLPRKQKAPKVVVQNPQASLTRLKPASLPLLPPVGLFSSMIQMSSVGLELSSNLLGVERAETPIPGLYQDSYLLKPYLLGLERMRLSQDQSLESSVVEQSAVLLEISFGVLLMYRLCWPRCPVKKINQ
ncbi:Interactor of constitutive active ROPs 5 [Senna tora]|uniref:Interactor of constitutive active ROPs 5 n=1 Tax=Senna tora TaxID=362788 RepID=A0A834WF28_9FABA|nr:Interactor of constitutive active ROPs 5 [Senna tora]